jgi:hypothetical protein
VEWVHLNMTGSPPPMVKLWTFCEKKRATTSSRQRFDMDSGKGHIESAVPVRRSCTQLHLFGQMDALRILTPDDRVLPWVMDGTRGKGIRGDWVIPSEYPQTVQNDRRRFRSSNCPTIWVCEQSRSPTWS